MSDTQSEVITKEINYTLSFLKKSSWIFLILGILIYSIFSYLPVERKLDAFIAKSLKSIPGCPLEYKDYNVKLFLPRIEINDLVIPGRCFNNPQEKIILKKTSLFFRGFGFSPIGPHFKIETNLLGNPLQAYITAGLGSVALKVDNNEINLAILKPFLSTLRLAGNVKIDAFIKAGSQKLEDFKLSVSSKNFILPSQNIMSFSLASLKINHLLIKAHQEDNKIKVQKFILGNEESPIKSNFNGVIRPNARNFESSKLDLKGEVKFSEDFLSKYAIIKLFLNKFTNRDNYYQIQVKGPLSRPSVDSPKS